MSIVVLPSALLLWDAKIDQSTISECGVAQRSYFGQWSICDWIRDINGFGLDHISHLHGQRCEGADCKVFLFLCRTVDSESLESRGRFSKVRITNQ